MAKKKQILNPEIYRAGLDIASQIIHNASQPVELAKTLVSRFRDLLDSYSIGITEAANNFLKENHVHSQKLQNQESS